MAISFGKKGAVITTTEKPKKRRKGVHAKTKTSKLKTSKFYAKAYIGQGN